MIVRADGDLPSRTKIFPWAARLLGLVDTGPGYGICRRSELSCLGGCKVFEPRLWQVGNLQGQTLHKSFLWRNPWICQTMETSHPNSAQTVERVNLRSSSHRQFVSFKCKVLLTIRDCHHRWSSGTVRKNKCQIGTKTLFIVIHWWL